MNFSKQKCNKCCCDTQCYCCKMPLILAEHLKLPCCNSMIHVQCVSNQLTCPCCKGSFNNVILIYIQNIVDQVKQQYNKRQDLRSDIKTIVGRIMVFRENMKKRCK